MFVGDSNLSFDPLPALFPLVVQCPACGRCHGRLRFDPLPPGGAHFTHRATCPVTDRDLYWPFAPAAEPEGVAS